MLVRSLLDCHQRKWGSRRLCGRAHCKAPDNLDKDVEAGEGTRRVAVAVVVDHGLDEFERS